MTTSPKCATPNRVLPCPNETYESLYRGPVAGYKEQRRTTTIVKVCCGDGRERETQIYRYRDEVLQQFGLVIVYKWLLRGPGCLVL